MLRKLMKYEFMAMGRVFLPLYAALLIFSVVNRLISHLPAETPGIIGNIVSVIIMVGIVIITLILILQRFRNNLMSNEGYLMMTLPVSVDMLILSKLFVASIWTAASVLVVLISILLMTLTEFGFSNLVSVFRFFNDLLADSSIQTIVLMVEALVLGTLTVFGRTLLLYTCMSLSLLVNKYRWLFAFGALIVITTVLQVIQAILHIIVQSLSTVADYTGIILIDMNMSDFGLSQIVLLMGIISELALCTAFYFITRTMLKRRLNLQ